MIPTCCKFTNRPFHLPRIRRRTYERLARLQGGALGARLRALLTQDPLDPLLAPPWYPALERRLGLVLDMLDRCIAVNGQRNVLVEDDPES